MCDSYKLMDVAAEHLPRRATVVDVGGGTGLMAETLLDERNDLTITLVEPSKEMAEIADTRLESPHRVVRGTLDDALPDLDPPTAFLFNRSLYALHGRAEDDAELMGRLFEAGDIEELAEGAGFAPVHGDFPVYLYRKPKRSWFHFGR